MVEADAAGLWSNLCAVSKEKTPIRILKSGLKLKLLMNCVFIPNIASTDGCKKKYESSVCSCVGEELICILV